MLSINHQRSGVLDMCYSRIGDGPLRVKALHTGRGRLRQALEIDQNRPGRTDDSSDRAAPHCLLGYLLEATNKGVRKMSGKIACATPLVKKISKLNGSAQRRVG